MLKSIFTFLIFSFSIISTTAQIQNTAEYNIESEIKNYGGQNNGNFYIVEKDKGLTSITLFNKDLQIINQFRDDSPSKKQWVSYISKTANNFIFRESEGYSLMNTKKTYFSDDNLDGDITNTFYYNDVQVKVDVAKISFLTDEKFVSICRKQGKEHYKNGEYEHINIFLYKRDIKSSDESIVELEFPEKGHFTKRNPKLLFHNEDKFILSYLYEWDNQKRYYSLVEYNYSGKIIKENKVDLQVENPKDKFAILNYAKGSFNLYRSPDYSTTNPNDYTSIVARAYATSDSYGATAFDRFENTYYVYSAINMKDVDDTVLMLKKYDIDGQLIWSKVIPLPETDLKNNNGANRFLKLDISSNFIAFNVYSTKGKSYCDFYLVNKEDGNIINSKQYRSFALNTSSKSFFGLYAPLTIKTDDFKNLELDRPTIYATLYDKDYMEYVKSLSNKEPTLMKSYFNDEGVNSIKCVKKQSTITLSKFLF